MYHIEREINEQPEVMARLLAEQYETAQRIAAAIRDFNPAFVHIAARGTSDNAGRYAQYLMGIHARLPVALAAPSIHTIYESAPDLSRALVLAISQSGRSDDVRRVVTDARAQGALTVSITNNADSMLAHDAEYHLPLLAGEEISVAATKTYTAELTAIAMLVKALVPDFDSEDYLDRLPAYAEETLKLSDSVVDWAQRYRYMDRFASIGRGYNYCTAFEVSLKIKELCYITGVEYSEADFRHGPIALVQPGFPVLVVAPEGKTLPLLLDLLESLKQKNAECLVISNSSVARDLAVNAMAIPAVPEWLSPLVAVIPGQTLAMRLALAKGHSVDKPEGLQKVTVTV
ncbi:MAG: SIS domain-containing protein [Anaerolineae bacterium]|nr:SIS domain-containing protein [Anaerolineae bacterium]